MVHTAPSITSGHLDLRAPSLAQIRKGIKIDSFRILSLLSSDCFALALTWQLIHQFSQTESYLGVAHHDVLGASIVLAIHIWFITAHGLYGADGRRRQYGAAIKAIALAHLSVVLLAFVAQPETVVQPTLFATGLGVSAILVCSGRWIIDRAIARIRQSGTARYSSLLICTADTVEQSTKALKRHSRYQIVGWTDANIIVNGDGWETTLSRITQLGISEVFLCSSVKIENPLFLYWSLRNAGITLHILPAEMNVSVRRFEISRPGRFPSVTFAPPLIAGSDFWIKRTFDFCAALILLVLLSPILGLIALLIKLDSPGPVFFKQTRMGLKNQEFKAWKFRTMVANAEQLQKKLEAQNETDGVLFKMKADPRITRVGGFLRQYSLDELPQLFNVLFGEMSLVGPRPLPMRDIEKFSSHHFIRHEVLPGITGLWQVSGRSDIVNFEDVVRLDLSYIENWSLWLDLKILFHTVRVVLQKTGAY
ncbi:MAG: sugar transferase [Leptolyngbyaceae bacterium]|nr:sugar transferase [Leptolyngbyaceae bacterium]